MKERDLSPIYQLNSGQEIIITRVELNNRADLYGVNCFEIVGNSMKYRYRRHITNTLLYAIIITAIMGIIRQYTKEGTIIFAIVSIIALGADRWVENKHLKEFEDKGVSPKP